MKKLILYFALIAVVINASSQNVVQGEYFIGSDPGFGQATRFAVSPESDINQTINIPHNLFPSPGYHFVFIRTMDENGKWGLTGKRVVEVDEIMNPMNEIRVEYFFDVDNGIGNNSFIQLNASNNSTWNFDIPFNQLPLAQTPNDILFLRVQNNSNGNWSLTSTIDSLNFTMVGIKELEEVGVSVFPNPFSDFIKITQKDKGRARFVLYDGSGRLMLDRVVEQTDKINTTGYTQGSYIVLVFTKNDKIYRSTLVKY
ncbi:MAG: T9SS type A sorting domain-containing protein [Bacteroidota bacterium]|nr:T9SS type A sorting domain-containing protein [Bacteroidota bacterium]